MSKPHLRELPQATPFDPLAEQTRLGEAVHLFVDARQSDDNPTGFEDGMAMMYAEPKDGRTHEEIGREWLDVRRRLGTQAATAFFASRYDMTDPSLHIAVPNAPDGMPIEEYEDYIARDFLRRPTENRGNRLKLPYLADVPGSRFASSFPADDAVVILGKLARGDIEGALDTLDNDVYQIQSVGFPANTWVRPFLGRTQTPWMSYPVEALQSIYGPEALDHYLKPLMRYYDFMTAGREKLANVPLGEHAAERRVIRMPDGEYMFRYWDDSPIDYSTKQGLRVEMAQDDFDLAEAVVTNLPEAEKAAAWEAVVRHVLAACESTQDFATRWFGDYLNMRTIRTTNIVPSDLNANMVHLGRTIAGGLEARGEYARARQYTDDAQSLADALNKYNYRELDDEHAVYGDALLDGNPTEALNAAMSLPLLVGGIANYDQAIKIARTWKDKLLHEYGFFTSDVAESTQQWDWDNIWPSLNMWVIEAFAQAARDTIRAGKDPGPFLEIIDMAKEGLLRGMQKWYSKHKNIAEKINGGDPEAIADRGEYGGTDETVQTGFGMSIGARRHIDATDYHTEVAHPDQSWRHPTHKRLTRSAGGLAVAHSDLLVVGF